MEERIYKIDIGNIPEGEIMGYIKNEGEKIKKDTDMKNVNYMQVVPNSHSFGSLKNILVSHEIQPDELTKDYLITGFKNTLKREYELKEFGESVNNEPVFSSINHIIDYLECLAFDSDEFMLIINNTLSNNIDLKHKDGIES